MPVTVCTPPRHVKSSCQVAEPSRRALPAWDSPGSTGAGGATAYGGVCTRPADTALALQSLWESQGSAGDEAVCKPPLA